MSHDLDQIKRILEAALLAAGEPLTVQRLANLFDEAERPDNAQIREALAAIEAECEGRGFELRKIASGYRFQVHSDMAPWVGKLWEEKPQRYSRATLETLALIAYRQPITRGDIEEIRGVAVSSQIIKTLQERDWVRVVGHRDVPGRPELFATTKTFLDYFNLTKLEDLPPLADIRDLDSMNGELEFVSEAEAAVATDNPDTATLESAADEPQDEDAGEPAAETDVEAAAQDVAETGTAAPEADDVEADASDAATDTGEAEDASVRERSAVTADL